MVVPGMIMLVNLRRGTTVGGHFAFNTLELDGRMVNAEFLSQCSIHLLENASALRWRDVGNGDVRTQSVRL